MTGIRVIALCPGPTQTATSLDDMRSNLLSEKYEALMKRDLASSAFQSYVFFKVRAQFLKRVPT